MLNATACILGPISIFTDASATFVELPITSPLLLFLLRTTCRVDFKLRPYHRKPKVRIGLGLVLIRPDSAQRHKGVYKLGPARQVSRQHGGRRRSLHILRYSAGIPADVRTLFDGEPALLPCWS